MPENKKEAEKAPEQVFILKIHKILKAPTIVGFKTLEDVEALKKQAGARYDFYKVPVVKL